MISVYSVFYRSCVSKRYQLVTGCLFVCMYLEKQPRVSKPADCSSKVAKSARRYPTAILQFSSPFLIVVMLIVHSETEYPGRKFFANN